MESIKNNIVAIVIFLILLVLILIRSTGFNHFKNDAKRWAEPSVLRSNTVDIGQAGTLPGKKLIINLDNDVSRIREVAIDAQNIPADSVLRKNYASMIMKHDGPVLLFSSETGLSARIWMILSQMGCRNLYNLTNKTDNEVFKYKFRSVQ